MGKDLAEELEYVSDQIESNPKNYQVWYHRRAIVEKMNDGSEVRGCGCAACVLHVCCMCAACVCPGPLQPFCRTCPIRGTIVDLIDLFSNSCHALLLSFFSHFAGVGVHIKYNIGTFLLVSTACLPACLPAL